MFCQKCGTENPENGRFCRACGTDLKGVSDALSEANGMGEDYSGYESELFSCSTKKEASWDTAIGKFFMGFAFLIVAGILGFTNAAGGREWWFWMLIPAFAMIGAGVSQAIKLRNKAAGKNLNTENNSVQISSQQQRVLPPDQTEYVPADKKRKYETGDLVPPSVVENTTRHLKMDSEGETRTLPKREV